MNYGISSTNEPEVCERIRTWERQRKDFLRDGEPMEALMVENCLTGAAVVLTLLGRTDLARLADAALNATVENAREATQ